MGLQITNIGRFSALVNSKGFKKYFTNTSWLFVDSALNLIIGFFIGVAVARYLSASEFGLLNFAKSVAKFFSIFCALGLEKIVVKKLIFDQENSPRILGTSFTLKVAAAIVSFILFAIIGYFLIEDVVTYQLSLAFVGVTLFESFVVIRFFFQSKVQSRFTARVVLFKVIISACLKLAIIYYHLPIIYFAYEALFEAALGATGYIFIYRLKTGKVPFSWNFNWEYAKSLLKDSMPLIFSSFVVYVYMEVDIIMLKYMASNEAVGFYSIAVKLTTIWHLFGIIVCRSLFPAVLEAKKRNEKLFISRYSNLVRFLVVISVAVVIGVFTLSDQIIHILFGDIYMPAVIPLQILIWSVIFVNLGVAGQQWYIAEDLQRILLIRTSLGALVNLILNITLIPQMGIAGAAIATLVAQISATFLFNALSRNTMKLFKIQARALIFLKTN